MAEVITVVEDKFPSGAAMKVVSLGKLRLGVLACVDGGFVRLGSWRKPVPELEQALRKLVVESVQERKKQIAALQREIVALGQVNL